MRIRCVRPARRIAQQVSPIAENIRDGFACADAERRNLLRAMAAETLAVQVPTNFAVRNADDQRPDRRGDWVEKRARTTVEVLVDQPPLEHHGPVKLILQHFSIAQAVARARAS